MKKNTFEKMVEMNLTCDICGKKMIAEYGVGLSNDIICCEDFDTCGAEIIFPTSTPVR